MTVGKLVGGVGTVLLAWSALLQLNDPDAAPWFVFYASAAVLASLVPWRPGTRRYAGIVALIGVGWALGIARHRPAPVSLGELTGSMGMKTVDVERWREMGGLLLTSTWLGATWWAYSRSSE
jgi:hypothetical protein